MKQIVIIGAGPVGLLNAIALQKCYPLAHVVILEKYRNYQRYHVVKVSSMLLKQFVDEIGGNENLYRLCDKIKKNGRIRTNELEARFKEVAESLGITIQTNKEVKNIHEDVYQVFPDADLIMGADGTHSIISDEAFGPQNKIKRSFDYVLQCRYEINGHANNIDFQTMLQFMQAYGITCHEFVGEKDEQGRTPVTFQLMITENQFNTLYPVATSKNPLRLFSDDNNKPLDPLLLKIIKGYLGIRLRLFTQDEIVDLKQLAIAVNEAPATRAKNVIKKEGDKTIILVGDAALGLSYFKGLNAGIETTIKLMSILKITDKQERDAQLTPYQTWFDEVYAPSKFDEVAKYSQYRIHVVTRIFNFLNKLLGKNYFILTEEAERSTDLYLGYLAEQSTENSKQPNRWRPYPHRQTFFADSVGIKPNSAIKNLKRIPKLFIDNMKPYKSIHHVSQDLLLPIKALMNLLLGLLYFVLVIPTLVFSILINNIIPDNKIGRLKRIAKSFNNAANLALESCTRIMLSIIMTMQLPLLPLRVFLRAAITAVIDPPLIEENTAFTRLVTSADNAVSTEVLNAYRVDLHRKFIKSHERRQASNVPVAQEDLLYHSCQPNDISTYKEYFRLFKPEANSAADLKKFIGDKATGSAIHAPQ